MNQEQIYKEFSKIKGNYRWVDEGNRLVGYNSYGKFNVVTALAHSRGGVFPNTKRGTEQAARYLGMSKDLALAIYSTSNRGHSQVTRGKFLKLIGS